MSALLVSALQVVGCAARQSPLRSFDVCAQRAWLPLVCAGLLRLLPILLKSSCKLRPQGLIWSPLRIPGTLQVENGTSGIPVGQPVAVMVEEEGEEPDMSTVAAPAAPEAPAPEPVAATPAPAEAPPPAATSAPTTTANTAGSAKPLSPAVLALVNRHGLDASLLSATGPKGHILKGCVCIAAMWPAVFRALPSVQVLHSFRPHRIASRVIPTLRGLFALCGSLRWLQ